MVAFWVSVLGAGIVMASFGLGAFAYVAFPLTDLVPGQTSEPGLSDPIEPNVSLDDPASAIEEPDEDPPYSSREAAPAEGAWTRHEGTVPSREDVEPHPDIRIRVDKDFNPANGIRDGSGTWADPYIISGWDVGRIIIADTDAYIVVRENFIRDQLVLNWNGDRVDAHHNHIGDLRVNQNVKRTGDATAGIIADNHIGRVGQLRHFDGEFCQNTVGDPDKMPLPTDPVAVNFDGFNGARFHHNTVYGIVDVRLHGHHHGSGFGAPSHHHGEDHPEGTLMDHTVRYHQVFVEHNTIISYTSYALRYFDRAHSANDRTAQSEENKDLNKPHVHYLKVRFADNDVRGGSVFVDVMNAEDKHHSTEPSHAWIDVENNRVTLATYQDRPTTAPVNFPAPPMAGVYAQIGRGVDLRVIGNEVTNEIHSLTGTSNPIAGIRISDFQDAQIALSGNRVSHTTYGIYARLLDETVDWYVWDNEWDDVKTPVWYDSSVENKPHEGPDK